MNWKSKTNTVLLLLLILTTAGYSEESGDTTTSDSIHTLDRVVVTATRTRRRISETPASVSIIDNRQIDLSPAKNIDDLLAKQTGIQMKRSVGMGEGVPSDIIIRAIPGAMMASRTLILIDGIPTNASGTPFIILNEVPLEQIKRVEVVRGPYSSLYGANAFGGVINIITKAGYGSPTIGGNLETSYPFTLAHKRKEEHNLIKTDLSESAKETYWNVNLNSSGGNDRISYLVNGGLRTIGNYLMRDSALGRKGEDIRYYPTENFDYRDIRLFSKMGFHINDRFEAEVSARYFDSELGFGKTKRLTPNDDILTAGRKWIISPNLKMSLSPSLYMRSSCYYRGMTGEFWNEEPIKDSLINNSPAYMRSYWKSLMTDWQIEHQAIIKVGQANILTSGFDLLSNNINFGAKEHPQTGEMVPGSYSNDQTIINMGLYIQDELSLAQKRLIIVPGIRLDYHSDFGSALSPKLGLSWRFSNKLRTRLSAGRAFRAPTLSELYMPDLLINPQFKIRANPNLQPEHITALDLALELTPVPRIKNQLVFFYNYMDNLVGQDIDLSNADDPLITHKNISEAWSMGVELENEFQIQQWLNIQLSATIQNSRDVSAGKIASEFNDADSIIALDYIPNFSADVGIRVEKPVGKVTLGGELTETFVGKRSYQEWTAVDPNNPNHVKFFISSDGLEVKVNPPRIDLDSYFRTDLSLKVTLPTQVWFAFNLQNIFDAQYEESGGTLAPGRFASLTAGGKFRFNKKGER